MGTDDLVRDALDVGAAIDDLGNIPRPEKDDLEARISYLEAKVDVCVKILRVTYEHLNVMAENSQRS